MALRKVFSMIIKWIGAGFVVLGCGSTGFMLAVNHCREEKSLRQFINILDYMECELQYRLTPLPELCRQVARHFKEMPGNVFYELSLEMDSLSVSDIESCVANVLNRLKKIPSITKDKIELFGRSVGRFDLEGQLKGIDAVRDDCRKTLKHLENNRENRLRSYQTLGLCAGAALAILLV